MSSPKNVQNKKFRKTESIFQPAWMEKPEFKLWLAPHPLSKNSARCKVCQCDLDLKSIRLSALSLHTKGSKHRNNGIK